MPSMTSSSTSDKGERPSPEFGTDIAENLTAKGHDTTNTSFPSSYLRTPPSLLPLPDPKWHIQPSNGEIYEVTSPIFEEYDPVTGYIGSIGGVRRNVEGGEAEMQADGEATEGWRHAGGMRTWVGYVEHPVSCERTSIEREAKRIREGKVGHTGARRDKRTRVSRKGEVAVT